MSHANERGKANEERQKEKVVLEKLITTADRIVDMRQQEAKNPAQSSGWQIPPQPNAALATESRGQGNPVATEEAWNPVFNATPWATEYPWEERWDAAEERDRSESGEALGRSGGETLFLTPNKEWEKVRGRSIC